jgi:hypothetical protein
MPRQLLNFAIVVVLIDLIIGLLAWSTDYLDTAIPAYYDFYYHWRSGIITIIRILMVLFLYFYFRHREQNTIWIIYVVANSLSVLTTAGWTSADLGAMNYELLLMLNFGVSISWLIYYCFLAFGSLKEWYFRVMGITGGIQIALSLLMFKLYIIEGIYEVMQILALFNILVGALWIIPFNKLLKEEEDDGNLDTNYSQDEYGRYRRD